MAFLGLFVLTLVIAHLIVESRHNKPLKAGGDIIEQVKNNGVASYLSNQNPQQCFLIKNSRGQVLGFTTDQFDLFGPSTQPDVQIKSLLYIRGQYAQQQTVFFRGTNNIDLFKWNYQSSGISGKKNIEVVFDETQTLTVSTIERQSRETKFRLKSAAIPELFLDLVMQQLLSSEYNKIIIDIIQSDGQITPLLITKIAQLTADSTEEHEYVLELKLLDSSGFMETVFINQQGLISKKLLHRERIILERADINTILKLFPKHRPNPDKSGLQDSEVLEQNQP